MCLGMNPDILEPGQRCASTSNRNFEGRQGRGGRTHLVSPAMAAAAAVVGHFTDPGACVIHPHIICFKDLDIRGMWAYPPMQFKTALSFLKNTKAPLDKFITHRLPLSSIAEGIDITGSEGSMKVVIEPGS